MTAVTNGKIEIAGNFQGSWPGCLKFCQQMPIKCLHVKIGLKATSSGIKYGGKRHHEHCKPPATAKAIAPIAWNFVNVCSSEPPWKNSLNYVCHLKIWKIYISAIQNKQQSWNFVSEYQTTIAMQH